MEHREIPTSEVLRDVVKNNTADRVSFYDLKTSLHERGFGIVLLVFILPLAIPMPYPPGFTTILIIPVFVFSLQMVYGADSPWLPQWLGNKTIKRTTIATIIEKAAPALSKIERLSRPRFFFAGSSLGERIVGIFCLIFSLSVAYPLPLTNLIPSIGIFIIALGMLGKDGIIIIIGIAVGIFGVAATTLVTIYGIKGAAKLIPWITSLFG